MHRTNISIALTKEALNCRHAGLCKLMLDCGSDPDDHRAFGEYVISRNFKVVRFSYLSFRSAYDLAWNWIMLGKGTHEFLEELRSLFPQNDRHDKRGLSKLHKIVLGLDPQPLQEYLLSRQIDLNYVDNSNCTALTYAARRGDYDAVKLLLIAGANPNAAPSNYRPPLFSAVSAPSIACVKLLLRAGANIYALDQNGYQAVHIACYDEAILEYLLKKGASINFSSKNGVTPLHFAVHYQQAGSIKILLERGAEVNTTDGEETPFLNSLYRGSDSIMEMLLAHGADYTILLKPKNSALHLAATYGGLRTIQILKAHKLRSIDPDAPNYEGKTVLELAREREKKENGFVKQLEELLDDIRIRNHLEEQSSTENTALGPTNYLAIARNHVFSLEFEVFWTRIPISMQILAANIYGSIASTSSVSTGLFLFLSLGWVGFAYVLLAGRGDFGEHKQYSKI